MVSEEEIEYFNSQMFQAEELLYERRRVIVDYLHIFMGMKKVLNEDDLEKITKLRLSAEQIFEILKSFEFNAPLVLCEIVNRDFQIPDEINIIFKARFKFDGSTWVIHQNDKDPFPSNPHAHNYAKGLTVNLGNGELCRGRQVVHKMGRKDLLHFRELILSKDPGIVLPALEWHKMENSAR